MPRTTIKPGQRWNRLTALRRDPHARRKWVWQCECGMEKSIDGYSVTVGRAKSCGCFRREERDSLSPGDTFGMLTIRERHSATRNGHVRWQCLCSCGNHKAVLGTHLKQGKITHCGCQRRVRGTDHHQWTGCGGVSGNLFSALRRNANGSKGRRLLPFDLTPQYLWALFQEQLGLCTLSGIPLTLQTHHDSNWTASLDRIDSAKGYIEGNVQWVHKDINRMKAVFSQEYFIKMCFRVAEVSGGSCEIDFDQMAMDASATDAK